MRRTAGRSLRWSPWSTGCWRWPRDGVQDLTDPQQWNAYSYCGNDPVSQSDPTGTRGDDLYYGPVAAVRIENNAVDESKRIKNNPAPRKENRNRDNGDDNNSSGGGGGGQSTGEAGNGSTGGSEHHAKPKQKKWWERTGDWVGEHKNQLIGAAVGIVTFVGCEAITSGVGTVGCMAVAGAAANITTGFLDGNIHNAQDLASSFITGAVGGILAVPLAAYDAGVQGAAVYNDIREGDGAGAAGHGALAALDVVTVVAGVKGLGGCKNSFAPATLVLLDHGMTKPISEIKIGDKVVASDPQADDTGTTLEEVEVLYDNLDNDLLDLTVKLDDGRSSVIHTTQHHPFWDQTTSKWVDAGDLSASHSLRDSRGTGTVVVSGVLARTGAKHMLNLTVTNLHTYYVLAGNTPVLVHNCGNRPPNLSPEGAGRGGAFNQAKRDSGIPTSQSPDRTLPNVDRRGNRQPGRSYEFDVPAEGGGTRTVRIRDDAGGHEFPNDPSQNRGPHFNTENGDHYDY